MERVITRDKVAEPDYVVDDDNKIERDAPGDARTRRTTKRNRIKGKEKVKRKKLMER